MKRKFKGGLTSVSLPVFIADTSSTTGVGLSGVTSASSGLVLEYRRQGQSTWTSVTAVSKTLGTYISGGIVADGSLAGAYEVDFPDAAFASGARMVLCRIRGVTNMLPVLIEIELDAVDYQDATAFGLSRIDAAVSSRSSQTSVDTLATYVDTEVAAIKAKTDNLPANPAAVSDIPTANAVASAVAATQALSRLDSMIESDGAGQFRFDTIALSMGAGGAGGTDWTANERTAIRSILGFDSNGTVSLPTVGVMDAIKDKTDLITSDGISVLEDRVNESTITMQYNESTTASVNLDEDTTSATLQFVVSRPDGTDILTIANGSITRTASSFTVTITTAVTATLGQYLWSLRDITGGTNRVVTKGVLTVQNAASA